MSGYTGEYFEHTSEGAKPSVYYTFTPKSLMNNDFYSIDEELSSLLIETHRVLGKLDGMIMYMPDSEILRELILYKNSFYSRQIDYSDADFYAALSARGCGQDLCAIKNIMSAYSCMSEKDATLNMISKICSIARFGINSLENASFRTSPMFLSNAMSNIRRYSPTAPEYVVSALNDMLRYWERDTSDVLIKAALMHYQFETIHPFECYNGIVGRVLITQTLSCAGITGANFISMSELLYEYKNNYFDTLSSTQKSGGYLRWIKFFVETILRATQRSIEQIEKYCQIVKCDESKLQGQNLSTSNNTPAVLNYWKMYLLSNITQPAKTLNLSYNTVERSIQLLQRLGILKQISSKLRYRQFVYTELIDLFLDYNR